MKSTGSVRSSRTRACCWSRESVVSVAPSSRPKTWPISFGPSLLSVETTISLRGTFRDFVFRLAGENLRLAANCPIASGRAHLASCQRTNPAVLQLESQCARFDLGLLLWALDLNTSQGNDAI